MNTKVLFFLVIIMAFIGMGVAEWANRMGYVLLEICGLVVMFGCVGIIFLSGRWLNPKDFV